MDVHEIIGQRRAYRSLAPVEIGVDLIRDLAATASLSASCFNNQPWRFVFVIDPTILRKLHGALSENNRWAEAASMIVAVVSRRDLDCVIKEREYYLFDCGMATAFMILRATELGLVMHPIAGYDEGKAREILGIPVDMRLAALLICGRHAEEAGSLLTAKQREGEKKRPERHPLERIMMLNAFKSEEPRK